MEERLAGSRPDCLPSWETDPVRRNHEPPPLHQGGGHAVSLPCDRLDPGVQPDSALRRTHVFDDAHRHENAPIDPRSARHSGGARSLTSSSSTTAISPRSRLGAPPTSLFRSARSTHPSPRRSSGRPCGTRSATALTDPAPASSLRPGRCAHRTNLRSTTVCCSSWPRPCPPSCPRKLSAPSRDQVLATTIRLVKESVASDAD